MVTLIVNPTVVTLTFTQNQLGIPIVKVKDDNDETIAVITVVHSMQSSKLLLRDTRTNIVYEFESIGRISDKNHLFEFLEAMLNHINLTQRQRIPK